MKLQCERNGGRQVLRPEGEFNIYGAIDFREALVAAVHAEGDIDVDLSAASEMDAAGLQLLLLARREAAASGKLLRLIAPGAAVLEVMGLCNLASRFEIGRSAEA